MGQVQPRRTLFHVPRDSTLFGQFILFPIQGRRRHTFGAPIVVVVVVVVVVAVVVVVVVVVVVSVA
jgi:hypothetical protein